MNIPTTFFTGLTFLVVVFLVEKTIATLHFGTRKWTRWLWVLLTVGLCPAFWVDLFWSDAGQLRAFPFALAAVFFSIKFLEDDELWDAFFPVAVVAAQVFLKIKIPVFEWLMLAAVGLFLLKKRAPFSANLFFKSSPLWVTGLLFFAYFFTFGISLKTWDWERFKPIFLPFWPGFGLFMPIYLFFLKKTDLTPLPKKWLATATIGAVIAAVLWPFTRGTGLFTAWLGMVVLTFPVFERGLLYGLVFVKKWKIWAIVAAFALIQIGVILYFF